MPPKSPSGLFRTQIGTAYTRLNNAITAFDAHYNDGDYRTNQSPRETDEDYLKHLKASKLALLEDLGNIQRSLNGLNKYADQWLILVSKDTTGTESELWENYVANKDFPTLTTNGENKLNSIESLSRKFDDLISNHSHSSPHATPRASSSSSHSPSPSRGRLRVKKVDLPTFPVSLENGPNFLRFLLMWSLTVIWQT